MTKGPARRVPLPALLLLAAALVVLAVAACGSPAPATVAPLPSGVASPVVGVPIDIDAAGFTSVKSFTIRTDDGRELTFAMAPLENAVEFPPNHLAEHLAASTKIRVFFRDQNGAPTAYRLEDVTP